MIMADVYCYHFFISVVMSKWQEQMFWSKYTQVDNVNFESFVRFSTHFWEFLSLTWLDSAFTSLLNSWSKWTVNKIKTILLEMAFENDIMNLYVMTLFVIAKIRYDEPLTNDSTSLIVFNHLRTARTYFFRYSEYLFASPLCSSQWTLTYLCTFSSLLTNIEALQ